MRLVTTPKLHCHASLVRPRLLTVSAPIIEPKLSLNRAVLARAAESSPELVDGASESDLEVDAVQQQRELKEERRQANRSSQRGGQRRKGEEWEDRIVQLNRVTKVLKGGKTMKFRACVITGNRKGKVGYGVASAKEVVEAVERATGIAKSNAIQVPMVKGRTVPHKLQIKEGAARIMLRPASEGTGVIAGGAVRVVLELAGYQNVFGKIYGTNSAMNNARGAIAALSQMTTWKEVAAKRGVSIDFAMGRVTEPQERAVKA